MIFQAQKKITGGKLLRVKILAEEYINDIQISGDFFLHPEETISQIEQNLKKLHVQTLEHEIQDRISNVLEKNKAIFVGIRSEDLTQLIKEALMSK